MELLLSSIPPIKPNNNSFANTFGRLITEADSLRIASGYISTESLTEIKRVIEVNNGPSLDLMIGMHYYDGITRTQYEAASCLNEFLVSQDMGSVSIATTFKFHGKLYSFEKEGDIFAGIMGSSNLNSMLDIHRNFETDILLTDSKMLAEIDSFIKKTSSTISKPISEWHPGEFIENNKLLEDHEVVTKISKEATTSIKSTLNGIVFDIPLKATDKHKKSNLNVYFGQGRKNTSTGFIKPRHWYEVELIVPKEITDHTSYPKAGYPETESIITVYTDDGWEFECKISGDYSKNFRSNNDLKTLGKWIKGRLENNGALQVGQLVTEDVLERYGRNTLGLKGTTDPNIWMLDFGV